MTFLYGYAVGMVVGIAMYAVIVRAADLWKRPYATVGINVGKGTLIHIDGIPFVLADNAIAYTNPANVRLTRLA